MPASLRASLLQKGEAPFHSGLILVTGGARAGKSDFALRLARQTEARRRLFVATAVACDSEMRRRISLHRKNRNGAWQTLEEPVRLPERLPKELLSSGTFLILDCLPTFITNLLLEKQSSAQVLIRVRSLLRACRKPGLSAVFVTNEVGLGIVPDHPLGREFRDLLGRVNQEAAAAADRVYFMVSGIPMRLK